MWDLVLRDRHGMEEGVAADGGLDFYHTTARFIGPYTLQVGQEQIKAPKIVLAIGVRTFIPDIPGLRETGFETSESIFDMQTLPRSLIILGGGYKACEFGHFFSAFGTKVSIIGHNLHILPREEAEVSDLVQAKMMEYLNLKVNQDVVSVRKGEKGKIVVIKDRVTGLVEETRGGRDPANHRGAEQCRQDRAGGIRHPDRPRKVHHRERVPGDQRARHIRHGRHHRQDDVPAHRQLPCAALLDQSFAKNKVKLDEHAVPHAVFGYPEVASVGMTAGGGQGQRHQGLGRDRASTIDCAKGYAMGERDSFAKVVVDMTNYNIIGVSAVGTNASILVQAMVYLMNAGDHTYIPLARSQTIHPALSEVMVNAFGNLHDPEHVHVHEHQTENTPQAGE